MSKTNTITTDGNGNVIINDTNNSTINVTVDGVDKFWDKLYAIWSMKINFLVMADENWLPFGTDTIAVCIDAYCANVGIKPNITLIDKTDLLATVEMEANFRYLRKTTILVVDAHALQNTHNQQVLTIFDDYHMGGCIIIEPTATQYNKNILKNLTIYKKKFPKQGISTQHICIENIQQEHHFYEALTNIIARIKQEKDISPQHFDSKKDLNNERANNFLL